MVSRTTVRTARWTSGSGSPLNQITGISPTWIQDCLFLRNKISPRLKAGDIDSEMTTIMGCVEPVMIVNAFQNMRGTVRASESLKHRPIIFRVCIFKGIVVENM